MKSQEFKKKAEELEKGVYNLQEALRARLAELQVIADEKGIHEFSVCAEFPEEYTFDGFRIDHNVEIWNEEDEDFGSVSLEDTTSKFELKDGEIRFTKVEIIDEESEDEDDHGYDVSFLCALSHGENWRTAYALIEAIEKGLGLI